MTLQIRQIFNIVVYEGCRLATAIVNMLRDKPYYPYYHPLNISFLSVFESLVINPLQDKERYLILLIVHGQIKNQNHVS